jgi:hypothetical protein
MIIQTIRLEPSGAVWTDDPTNVSRLDPSGADQIDAEHPSRNRNVVGSNPTSGSIFAGQRAFLGLLAAWRQQAVIPLGSDQRAAGACPAWLRFMPLLGHSTFRRSVFTHLPISTR